MDTQRIIIHTADIMHLTGYGLRYAQKLLKDIRIKLNKSKAHLVTITEFCDHGQYSLDEVVNALNK